MRLHDHPQTASPDIRFIRCGGPEPVYIARPKSNFHDRNPVLWGVGEYDCMVRIDADQTASGDWLMTVEREVCAVDRTSPGELGERVSWQVHRILTWHKLTGAELAAAHDEIEQHKAAGVPVRLGLYTILPTIDMGSVRAWR